MSRIPIAFLSLYLLCATALSQAKAVPATPAALPPAEVARLSTVVVSGNGLKITVGDIEQSLKYVPPQFMEHFDIPEKKEAFIREYVLKILFAREAKAKGLMENEKIKSEIEDYINNTLYIEYSKELTDNIPISNEEIKSFYEINRMQYALPERVRVRHILVKTEADAAKVKEQLGKGTDFAELAKQYSIEKVSAAKGGEMGAIRKGDTDLEFEKAAFSLPIGQSFGPVKTRQGFEFLRVDAKLPMEILPLETVKPTILNQIAVQKKNAILESARSEYIKKYKVEFQVKNFSKVNPKNLMPKSGVPVSVQPGRPEKSQPAPAPSGR